MVIIHRYFFNRDRGVTGKRIFLRIAVMVMMFHVRFVTIVSKRIPRLLLIGQGGIIIGRVAENCRRPHPSSRSDG